MGATRRKFTPQYRRDAARLVIDSGRTARAVADEIGVGEQLLGRWVANERARMEDPPPAVDINERAELERLRAENTQLRMDREFLKKSSGLLRSGERVEPDAAFAVIHAEKATLRTGPSVTVSRMCDLLGVSRSGYYDWATRQHAGPGPREARLLALADEVRRAHKDSDGAYGAPRITAELRAAGEVVSVKTVAKVMRRTGIEGISPRTWHPVTTIVDPSPHAIPDLVERRFDTGEVNRVWTSDITYLATGQGWLYLCAIRDGCSRRVLGYAFSDSLHTDLVEDALRRAVTFRDGDTHGVILHADRGCQYTSQQLHDAAEALNVRLSVGRTGVCWDNAQQESFWSTLKTEFYHRYQFTTHAAAIHGVTEWIETVYNRRRRHSALGYFTPVAFEHHITTAAQAA
ncbi:MAG: IS3 family transposase [Tetrasphaera jenkinsii]|nr:IS3 family transposase [Tetrasphaera jenkinsii]